MNRVTIVNLAGRAYHVDEDGAAAIAAWLDSARTRLAQDPDRDELLADFERAIAERCEAHAQDARAVVTTAQVGEILAALGDVEPAAGPLGDDAADTTRMPTATTTAPDADGWRERKLYRLTGEDAMLAGVCSGLAAYFRLDVTVVRVAVVLLTLLTSGLFIVTYIVMAIIVPEADSPDKRAAARGYGDSAQEMIARARAGAGPAMASLGSLLARTWSIVARVAHWFLIAVVWVLTAAWAVQVSWLWIGGGGIDTVFDDGTSTWLVALWVTCIAWIFIGFALALVAAFDLGRGTRRARRDVALGMLWSATMIAAIVGLFAIPATSSEQLRSLDDGNARIEAYGQTVCFNLDRPRVDDDEACQPGDETVYAD